jgi:hypothetical protein
MVGLMDTSEVKCIWCLQMALPGNEHIISRFLAGFGPKEFTMKQVCSACNNKFGTQLETHLRRDSVEGYLSYMYRLSRPPELIIQQNRLEIEYVAVQNQVLRKAVPMITLGVEHSASIEAQIILERENGTRHIYPVSQLAKAETKKRFESALAIPNTLYLVVVKSQSFEQFCRI